MPESLKTFLLTKGIKRLDSLRYICDSLGLSADGITEALRERILAHVEKDGNGATDTKVRDLAQQFSSNHDSKSEENKKKQEISMGTANEETNVKTTDDGSKTSKGEITPFSPTGETDAYVFSDGCYAPTNTPQSQ